MHVRLKGKDARRLRQSRVTFGADVVGIRRNVQVRRVAGVFCDFDVFGRVSLRLELQAEGNVGCSFLTYGVEMEIEINLGPSLYQAARTFWEYVGVFAECVFIKESPLGGYSSIRRRIILVLH